jgi:GxxExxY protein
MTELVLKDEVYQVVGAAMDVYYQLGRGFLEPVYQEAIEIELGRRDIPFEAQKRLMIVCTSGYCSILGVPLDLSGNVM